MRAVLGGLLAATALSAAAQAPLWTAQAPLWTAQAPWTTTTFPQDRDRAWWDDAWWERGVLSAPVNHEFSTRKASYRSGDAEIPVEVHVPWGAGRFPVVVFLHGRRGIDELTSRVPRRLAARGFTVVVPDFFTGRLIDPMPVRHDPAIEDDAARAIDFALSQPEAQGQARTCVVSHTRGGFYALQALVAQGRQARTACYVAYYPHWQHPEAPEAAQVYQFAPQVESLVVPVLVFLGEHEQYQRTRSILAGIDALRALKRDAEVIVYPGVGRGFDFRPRTVRTFADDLAAKDAMLRTAAFLGRHLGR